MTNYKGTYFLKNENRSDQNWSNSENILVNTQSSFQLKEEILRVIGSAKKCLKICSFILNDMNVYEALKQKLVQEDVVLFLLTSLNPSTLASNYLTEEEEARDSIKIHQRFISTLYNLGGHVRAASNIHAKFIIADSNEALIMSANLTKFSLNLNPESGIKFSNQDDVRSIEILFEKIYLKATTFKSFRKRAKGKSYVESLSKQIGLNDFSSLEEKDLTFTYEDLNNSIYKKIISIIDNADSYITIGTYSIVELGNLSELIESLERAKQRGVDIKFFCRAMNHRSDHLEGCRKILELDIPVFGDLYNHAKGIVSETEGMIFTANIDGKYGLKSSFEVGLILQGEQLSSLDKFLKWQIETAHFTAVNNPIKKELHVSESYKEHLKRIVPVGTAKSITIDTNSIDLKSKLENYPFYILCKGKKIVGVKVGRKTYEGSYQGSKLKLLGENKLNNHVQFMVKYENLNII